MRKLLLGIGQSLYASTITHAFFFLFYQAYFNIKQFGWSINSYIVINDWSWWVFLMSLCSLFLGSILLFIFLVTEKDNRQKKAVNTEVVEKPKPEPEFEPKTLHNNDFVVVDSKEPTIEVIDKSQSITDILNNLPDRKITIIIDEKSHQETESL